MKRTGKTPLWPPYLDRSFPDRRLAILHHHTVETEVQEQFTVEQYEDVVRLLFSENLLIFVSTLTDQEIFPFLESAMNDEDATVLSTKHGEPLAIQIRKKNSLRWIVPAACWDRIIVDTFLSDMRALYKHVGLVKPTPGSLGQALMRRYFLQHELPKHSAPNVMALNYLQKYGHGGRCDVFHVGEEYPVLLELDMSDAYLAHFMELPTGTSYHFLNGHTRYFRTWFAECDITIRSELALGPFPIKRGYKNGKIVWPTLPGTYTAYLWKEQAEDCLDAGCTVKVKNGYGWKYTTCDTSGFCLDMHSYRVSAGNDSVEHLVKKTIVSGLGHFGMKQQFYSVVSLDDGESPCIIDDYGNPLRFYVKEEVDYSKPSMLHWYNYLIMQTARSLYRYALPYAVQGRLIMTNYDALLIQEVDERQRYARKHSLEALMAEAGDLRWQELTNVKVIGPRSLKCDQKLIRPGVTGKAREEIVL